MRNKLVLLVVVLVVAHSLTAAALEQGEKSFFEKVFDHIKKPIRSYIDDTWGVLINGLTYNPVLFCVPGTECGTAPTANCCEVSRGAGKLVSMWLQIMVPFYIIAMLLTAMFFLLKAGTPRGRARARSMFLKLLLGMVVIALAPVIYQTMLDSSLLLTKMFLYEYKPSFNFFFFTVDIDANPFGSINDVSNPSLHYTDITETLSNSPSLTFTCFLLPLTAFLLVLAGLFIWLRNILVFFYGVFFPIILFFYFFEITKPYGRKWLNQAMKWIYVPAFQALILILTIQISNSVELMTFSGSIGGQGLHVISNTMAGMMVLAGIAGFALAPLIVGHLMSWLGQSVIAVGLGAGRTWMVGLGGILAGHGPNALPYAHGEFTRQRSFERYMGAVRGVGGAATARTALQAKGATGVGGRVPPSAAAPPQSQIPEESGGEQGSAESGGQPAAPDYGPVFSGRTPVGDSKPKEQERRPMEGGGAGPDEYRAALDEARRGTEKTYSISYEAESPTEAHETSHAPEPRYDEERRLIEMPPTEEGGVAEGPPRVERRMDVRRAKKPDKPVGITRSFTEKSMESLGGRAGAPLPGRPTPKTPQEGPNDESEREREAFARTEERRIEQMVGAEEQARKRETAVEEEARNMEADKEVKDRRRTAEEKTESDRRQAEKKSDKEARQESEKQEKESKGK